MNSHISTLSRGWPSIAVSIWIGVEILLTAGCTGVPHAAYNRALDQLATDPSQAETAFFEAVRKDPKNPEAWNQLGIIAFERHELDVAETRFRRACELNRLNPAYPRNLALVYADRKQYDLARSLLKKSLDLDPADPDTYIAIAKVQILQGKTKQAAETIQKALQVNPSHPEALKLRSYL